MCGGTVCVAKVQVQARGLSPRVRGNQWYINEATKLVGSIPACAGEPRSGDLGFGAGSVYPRVCGGTNGPAVERRGRWGLSPRVRGNQ